VEMWDMNWTVQPGSCLRLDVSSSDFPQYAVHSNYAGVWSEQEKTRIAHQKILLGEGSFVELPLHEN
jgi:hydrolase, cocE/nonD family